ncbi:mitochondrial ATP synthase epsilon chain-domain-containing protein [Protomyces lactucae-debilis]|uniref:Mitochondrial ATP synthase epsilon chain-domain-containing protein n=1 Tax=Protomyces lactucae-debilis TaxID=2754530 RepID=A0A1Y2F7S5_PROLT|nr:mitochondrial ATP synthase epsilon chain-domain-containing protein [Protomyces lactucae-debilis]ORY79921.1 mitochondrial ATP synthase epsilon chain-domain-containing protein [Protomyces lactucae-debilis]
MTFAWRNVFTYNKYASIAAATVRKSLKEQGRLAAEKRGDMEIKVAKWDNGKQGPYKNVREVIEKSS